MSWRLGAADSNLSISIIEISRYRTCQEFAERACDAKNRCSAIQGYRDTYYKNKTSEPESHLPRLDP